MSKPRVVCDANPMCFGSSSALLAIVDHLDAHTTALAHGVTAELLGVDPAVDEVLDVDVKDSRAVGEVLRERRFDAALVVSNQANVAAYAAAGLPVFFVDILYWYGARKNQTVWRLAYRTFVQAFPGVVERVAGGETPGRPVVVGPLVRRIPVGSARHGTLVNIGGARSRFVVPGQNSPYVELVCRWMEAMQQDLPAGPIDVACGVDAVRVARSVVTTERIAAATLAQPAFLARLGSAALYLTAPGLNAVFEGLLAGSEMVILPPQNATQVLQLAHYEAAGLVPPGLNLDALVPGFEVPERVGDEAELTRDVLGALAVVARSEAANQHITDHLRHQIRTSSQRTAARRDFLGSLGPLGGPAVAGEIAAWWAAL